MGRGSSRLLQPAPTVFLELEVLSARGLADEAAGRCSGALRELGMTMNPCVQVFVQGNKAATQAQQARRGNVRFHERLFFPVDPDSLSICMQLQVLDLCRLGPLVRGLVGEASVHVKVPTFESFRSPGSSVEVIASEDSAKCSPASRSLSSASTAVPESKMSEARVVPLMRERRRVGELVVRWRIEELDSAYRVLRRSTQHSLDDIATALTKILSGPWGKTLMMDSLPSEVCRTNQQATSQAMEDLVDRLRYRNESFPLVQAGLSEDDVVTARLAHVSRGILSFVAKRSSGDTMAISSRWLRNLFSHFVSSPEVFQLPRKEEARLRRFLLSAQIKAEELQPVDESHQRIPDTLMRWGRPERGPPNACLLGKGTYGFVWRARDRCTGNLFAVKTVRGKKERILDIALREYEVADRLRSFPHPCVVRVYHTFHKEAFAFNFVMEFCHNGHLAQAIMTARRNTRKPNFTGYVPPLLTMTWISEIFLGLEHLHLAMNTLLRDVKPENVVINKHGHAKLCDFGFSKLSSVSDGNQSFGVPPGTPAYVAPEVLQCTTYDYKADLYSYGVLVWVLLTGGIGEGAEIPLPPYNKYSNMNLLPLLKNWQLLEKCIHDPGTKAPPLRSEEAKDFIIKLTHRGDRLPRPTHADVRAHPFLHASRLPPALSSFATVARWMGNTAAWDAVDKWCAGDLHVSENLVVLSFV